jgi:hypothetical protein
MDWTTRELVDFQQGQVIFLFSETFGVALGPTQFSVQWELGALLLEEKQPGHEAHL